MMNLKLCEHSASKGKTPLVTRVSNEVFRLKKQGSIIHTQEGYAPGGTS